MPVTSTTGGTAPWWAAPQMPGLGRTPRQAGADANVGGGFNIGQNFMGANLLGNSQPPHLGFGPGGYGPQPGTGDYAGSLYGQGVASAMDRFETGQQVGNATRGALRNELPSLIAALTGQPMGGGGGFGGGGGGRGAGGAAAPGMGLPGRVDTSGLRGAAGRAPPAAPAFREVGAASPAPAAARFGPAPRMPRIGPAPELGPLEGYTPLGPPPERVRGQRTWGDAPTLAPAPGRVQARGGLEPMPALAGQARAPLAARNDPNPDPLLDALLGRFRGGPRR